MFVRAGLVSLLLLLASRVLGLLRETAQAAAFGNSALGDVAVLMFTLPDLVANIFVGGTQDGHAQKDSFQASLNPVLGNIADGHSHADTFEVSLNPYLGNLADGHAHADSFEMSLNAYVGGIADGHARMSGAMISTLSATGTATS